MGRNLLLHFIKKRTPTLTELKKSKRYVTQNLRKSTNVYVTERFAMTCDLVRRKEVTIYEQVFRANMNKLMKMLVAENVGQ